MEVETSHGSTSSSASRPFGSLALCLYIVAFVTGAIVMSFEMLGSRYLGPSFGLGIYTWASLISTVLAALCVGYFIGGALADRHPSPFILGATITIASAYLLLLPAFAQPVLQFFVWNIDDIKWGGLASAMTIMFFPVALLGMYSPFAIRLLLHSKQNQGAVSGAVYGVSTAGSISTLGTTFFLIPWIGSRAITFTLGALGLLAGVSLLVGASSGWRRDRAGGVAVLLMSAALLLPVSSLRAEEDFVGDRLPVPSVSARAQRIEQHPVQRAEVKAVVIAAFGRVLAAPVAL